MAFFDIQVIGDKPDGIISCISTVYSYLAYKIPRNLKQDAMQLDYVNDVGVYILFGRNTSNGDYLGDIYVGQGDVRGTKKGVLTRMYEHHDIDWTEGVVFVHTDNKWNATHINYAEDTLHKIVKDANSYNVRNKQEPGFGKTPLTTKDEIDNHFISIAKQILGIFGYMCFKPNATVQSGPTSSKNTTTDGSSPNESEESPVNQFPELYMTYNKSHSAGKYEGKNFVVLKGSVINPTMGKKCDQKTKEKRENKSYVDPKTFKVLMDISFESPSAAARFVGGSALSGNECWHDKKGNKLGDLLKNREELPLLYMVSNNKNPKRKINATGVYTNEGKLIVKKGSLIATEKAPKCRDKITKLRNDNSESIDYNTYETIKDITFDSPSQAAYFVLWGSVSGQKCWHDKNGTPLYKILEQFKDKD